MLRTACLAFLFSALASAASTAGVDKPPGVKLTGAQLKRILVGKGWNAQWGPFAHEIVFDRDGVFRNGISAPMRWRFSGNQICIARTKTIDNCLDFYIDAGNLTAWIWSSSTGQYLQAQHGPIP